MVHTPPHQHNKSSGTFVGLSGATFSGQLAAVVLLADSPRQAASMDEPEPRERGRLAYGTLCPEMVAKEKKRR